jgi:hypothetical protein
MVFPGGPCLRHVVVSVLEQRVVDALGALLASTSPVPFNVYTDHLTKSQMAKAIGRGERTLDNWHRKRQGPPRIKLGGVVLYNLNSFRKWLAEQEIAPGAAVKPQHPNARYNPSHGGGRPLGSKNRPRPAPTGIPVPAAE